MLSTYRKTNFACSRLITLNYTKSFNLAILTFDIKTRNSIYALYSFLRYADEIIDTLNNFDRQLLFEEFKNDTYKAIQRGISSNPVLDSFQSIVNTYNLELDLIDSFFNSMAMDFEKLKYDEERHNKYVYGSAEVPCLLCLKIVSWPNIDTYNKNVIFARKIAIAFQRINFLRDLSEDFLINKRDYLYYLRDKDEFNEAVKTKLENEIKKNLKLASPSIKLLPKSWRWGAFIAFNTYVFYLKKIQKKTLSELLTTTIKISLPEKALMLLISSCRIKLSI